VPALQPDLRGAQRRSPVFSKLLLSWGQLVEGHGGPRVWRARRLRRIAAGVHSLRNAQVPRPASTNALWKLAAIGERLKLYQLGAFLRTIGMLLRGGRRSDRSPHGRELLHPLCAQRGGSREPGVRERPSRLRVRWKQPAPPRPLPAACRPVGRKAATWADDGEDRGVSDEEISSWIDGSCELFEPLLDGGDRPGDRPRSFFLMYMPIFELAGSLKWSRRA